MSEYKLLQKDAALSSYIRDEISAAEIAVSSAVTSTCLYIALRIITNSQECWHITEVGIHCFSAYQKHFALESKWQQQWESRERPKPTCI